MRSNYPHGTMWQHHFGPRVGAAAALANQHSQQAIALLNATRPLDDRDPDTRKLRGDAYLAAGQAPLAEREYRAILAHREIERSHPPTRSPGSFDRALVTQGKQSQAVNAYQHFFALLAHADPEANYSGQAKQKFTATRASASVK